MARRSISRRSRNWRRPAAACALSGLLRADDCPISSDQPATLSSAPVSGLRLTSAGVSPSNSRRRYDAAATSLSGITRMRACRCFGGSARPVLRSNRKRPGGRRRRRVAPRSRSSCLRSTAMSAPRRHGYWTQWLGSARRCVSTAGMDRRRCQLPSRSQPLPRTSRDRARPPWDQKQLVACGRRQTRPQRVGELSTPRSSASRTAAAAGWLNQREQSKQPNGCSTPCPAFRVKTSSTRTGSAS